MERPAAPDLAEVARVLADAAGVSLAGGLERLLERGLHDAASALGEEPVALARRIAAREPDAIAALVEHALVAETAFWRHPAELAALSNRLARTPRALSIWCAGCATGEEPYSVAMALLEAGRPRQGDHVLGTDLSERALAVARAGLYPPRSLRRLPLDRAGRWMEGAGEQRRVGGAVRALVSFARHNLAADPAPAGAPFDAVLCRNVLIYFDPAAATAVLHRLLKALRPGGALVLGPVELQLAAGMALDWVVDGGATLLVRRS